MSARTNGFNCPPRLALVCKGLTGVAERMEQAVSTAEKPPRVDWRRRGEFVRRRSGAEDEDRRKDEGNKRVQDERERGRIVVLMLLSEWERCLE
jgi:hypothetical protein